ncbi:unnamed protein product, partial [Adineta steineri]
SEPILKSFWGHSTYDPYPLLKN